MLKKVFGLYMDTNKEARRRRLERDADKPSLLGLRGHVATDVDYSRLSLYYYTRVQRQGLVSTAKSYISYVRLH